MQKLMGKKWNIALPVFLTLFLLIFLMVGGDFFMRYLEKQIFQERTTQLVELVSQVRVNLDSALESHRDYLNTATHILEEAELDTTADVIEKIRHLEQIMDTEYYNSIVVLLDSQGNCYDVSGRRGVWPELDRMSGNEDRYTYIADNYMYSGSYWAFTQRLDTPVQTREDGISFTHVLLLKDIRSMVQYYSSAAYSDHNETYILKSNGTRLHDELSQEKSIQAYNVLKVLEEMEGQRYPDICAALAEENPVSSNFRRDGIEYYYCAALLEEYDTILLFLTPAQFVAVGTVQMMNAVVRTMLFLAVVLLALLTLVVVTVLRQQSSARLVRQEQANLRQLEEANTLLTQSKEATEQAFQIAKEANQAKSSFLSNMSHDIRTPMNAIVGFAALLARDAENPEKVREYTRKITSSSQHLLGLINDVLDISKIEAGKTTLNLSDESIIELIENIDSIIRPQMKAKGHRFEVYSRDIKHEQAVMDKLRLNQILLNLLSNAVKYTPDGGHITLTVQELPQYTKQLVRYRFIVADSGYGMSEEYQKKLFQTFRTCLKSFQYWKNML